MNARKETYNFSSMEKFPLDKLISILKTSSLSDREIADKCGVTRGMVYRWRTGQVKSIRRNNFVAVCNSLGYKVGNISGEIELAPLNELVSSDTTTEEILSDMSNTNTIKLIETLSNTNAVLIDQLDFTKSALEEENKRNKILQKENENYKRPMPDVNVDHSRKQFVADMERQVFINVTQEYADLHGMKAFDIMRDYSFLDLMHPDDIWRLPIVASLGNSHLEEHTCWKIKEKSTIVRAVSYPLSDTWVKTDIEISDLDGWERSNEFYRTHDKGGKG